MASKKNSAFLLGGELEKLVVTGGPNDWDLWLCLRGTLKEVSFYTDRPVQFPGFSDCATFFSGKIQMLVNEGVCRDIWHVEGIARKGSVTLRFKGKYISSTRHGEFTFF